MMPRVSIVFIRWSLIQLAIASTIGLIILISKASEIWLWSWSYRPLHTEAIWFGWIINFVIGTAWWIMPKRPDLPDKFGNEWFAWLSFTFLQIDWLYRVFVDVFNAPTIIRFTPLAAIICFVIGIWPRLKHIIHEH